MEKVELADEKGVLSTMNMAGLIELFGLDVSNALTMCVRLM
jgi:hypothetical protein